MPGLATVQERTLEAMLFASPQSVPLEKLAAALECDIPLTRNLLERMMQAYERNEAGIILVETDGCYRLCTNPAYYDAVRRLLEASPPQKLSPAMLETLAVIAFKQPCTNSIIESIRGTNSYHLVNKLLEYGLVVEMGRLDAPGRPILFGTSERFLLHFGLKSCDDLYAAANSTAAAGQVDHGDDRQLTIS